MLLFVAAAVRSILVTYLMLPNAVWGPENSAGRGARASLFSIVLLGTLLENENACRWHALLVAIRHNSHDNAGMLLCFAWTQGSPFP